MFFSGAHELWGLVDEGHEVGVLGGIATGAWGRREGRGPRRPLPSQLRALAGGGGPEEAEGLEEVPRGRHGGEEGLRRARSCEVVGRI